MLKYTFMKRGLVAALILFCGAAGPAAADEKGAAVRPVLMNQELIGAWDGNGQWRPALEGLKLKGFPDFDPGTAEGDAALLAKLAEGPIPCESPLIAVGDRVAVYGLDGVPYGAPAESELRGLSLYYEGEASGQFRVLAKLSGWKGPGPQFLYGLVRGSKVVLSETRDENYPGDDSRYRYYSDLGDEIMEVTLTKSPADAYGVRYYAGRASLGGREFDFGEDAALFGVNPPDNSASASSPPPSPILAKFLDLNGDGRPELALCRETDLKESAADAARPIDFELHVFSLDQNAGVKEIFSYFWTDLPE